MKHGPRTTCVVFGAVFIGSLIATSTGQPVRAQQNGDPLDLFVKMYPVFTHPRCINCHGVVQSNPGIIRSVTAETHPGGWVGDPDEAVACDDCHKEPEAVAEAWEFTAPQSMWWIGKSVEELCVLQAAQVRNFNRAAGSASPAAKGSYLNHLANDPLITQAFVGLAGGARFPKPADPPPMQRDTFLAAAKAWVDAGAPCRATGSITQVETFSSNYSYPYPVGPDGKMAVRESAKRDVHITRYPDGTAKAQVTVGGSQRLVTSYQMGCPVTMTNTSDWINLNQGDVAADVKLDLKDGRYEIRFTLPADTTRQRSAGRTASECGVPPMSSDNSVDVTWQPWNFTIRCPATFTADADNTIVCNPLEPRDESTASGEMTRKIVNVSRSAEPQSWLRRSLLGISRADTGAPLPITVTTTWFLNLK